MSPEEFVERAYRLVLRREPDDAGRRAALEAMGSGALSRATFLYGLVASPEFARLRALDDAIVHARHGRLRGLSAPPDTDERLIEIPWVLSRYAGERRVLDAGCAYAPGAYLDALVALGAPDLVGVDLAEHAVAGLRSVMADLRALPFADASFDLALCVSTLEHVGWDNRVYGLDGERDEGGMATALRELHRVLAGGGRLLVTVPCGIAEHHGWFVQRPARDWLAFLRGPGFVVGDWEVYALGEGGWGAVEADPPVRYGERGPAASAVLCAELRR